MTKQTMTALAIAVVVGAGCAKDDKRSPYAMANRGVEAPPDDFGTRKEPPIAAATHLAAGEVSESRGDMTTALDQYEKAVKVDPKLPRAWYQLAALRARTRQYDKSIAAWETYLKLVGNDPAGYANLGFTHDLAGHFTAAEAAYQQGIQINPRHKASRVNYGLMLAKAGRPDEAVAQFGAVLPPAEVRYNLASVYEQQGKIEQARAEYEAALKIDPKFQDAARRLAALPVTKAGVQAQAPTN